MAVRVLLVALALVALNLVCAHANDDVCQEVASPTGMDDTIMDHPIHLDGYCSNYCRCSRDSCSLQSCGPLRWFNPKSRSCEISGRDCLWYKELVRELPSAQLTEDSDQTTSSTLPPIAPNGCMTHPGVGVTLGPKPEKMPSSCPPDYTNLLIPDPAGCQNFIACNYGVATVMRCPASLKFRYDLQLCDYPHCTDC